MTIAGRLLVGLGIPFVAVVPTIPLLSRSSLVVAGLPVAVAWLFLCIPLTAACLGCCWWLHDRHLFDDEDDGAEGP
ncbi:DUF3311 domain-containing protein [Acetobacteraceae bacterium KSS8]|uniref:DUF3311 domain-containing protein n=1 Tax=Endosaccharibacter trunci TaxID=2812733 RepID=A0ABT1WBC8_9PROT|nr:DUF3311 domain-containing protein [Acetobacteraceae bacterium KSS8]